MTKFHALRCAVMALILCQCGRPQRESKLDYGAADAHLVEISFDDHFFLPVTALSTSYHAVSSRNDLKGKDRRIVREALMLQIQHLYGVFSYHSSPTDFASNSGAVIGKRKPKISRVRLSPDSKKLRVDYQFRNRAIFYQNLLEEEAEWAFSFFMPNQPTTLYRDSLPPDARIDPKTKAKIHPCTDLHDNAELAFWYYWSPQRPGCPKKIYKLVHEVRDVHFRRLPQTEQTYPEYERLYEKDLKVHLLIGQDEAFGEVHDLGRRTYQHEVNYFAAMRKGNGKPVFHREESTDYNTLFSYETDRYRAELAIDYLDTDSKRFDALAVRALLKGDLLIFAGHSYEGYYFNLERLFPGQKSPLPKDNYQIMFFNACTTTSYYGQDYFAAKKSRDDTRGRKNLDLLTNGIGAPFLLDVTDGAGLAAAQNTADTILVASLLGLDARGRTLDRLLSWQEILSRISENAGYDFTALTNVQGDEDNPRQLEPSQTVPQPLP